MLKEATITTHNLRTSLQGVWERLQARAPARYLVIIEWQGDDESAVSVGLDLGDGTPRGHSVPFGQETTVGDVCALLRGLGLEGIALYLEGTGVDVGARLDSFT